MECDFDLTGELFTQTHFAILKCISYYRLNNERPLCLLGSRGMRQLRALRQTEIRYKRSYIDMRL